MTELAMSEFDRMLDPKDNSAQRGPRRHAIPQGRSEKSFSRNASKTHYKNLPTRCPMRGGIRL